MGMASKNVEITRWTMACPITNAIFEEPVVAEDGHTYSEQAIRDWFASCKERGLPVTSPLTRKEMSEQLTPNMGMKTTISAYREERTARAQDGKTKHSRPPTAQDGDVEGGRESVKSLAELGHMFSLLDGLRVLLAETLDGWQPPQIVVVGQESSGKSSVLGLQDSCFAEVVTCTSCQSCASDLIRFQSA